MQPDEWDGLTATGEKEIAVIARINAKHRVTLGQPVQGEGYWGVSAFPYEHRGVIVVGKGATLEAALVDLERKLDARA